MLAHHIMTSDVITVGADSTVVEAADTMLRHHISGLPVVDAADNLIGILSEGDFIRRAEIGTERKRGRWLSFLVGRDRIASDFVHAYGRKVDEIMTPNPKTVNEDTPLDEIARIMESHDIKRVPVVRGKRVVGIVTRSDFLAAAAGLARNVPHPPLADEDIRRAVSEAIGQASWRPRRLNITVRDGIVTLRGVVERDHAPALIVPFTQACVPVVDVAAGRVVVVFGAGGERDRAKTKLEQAIAPAGLAVVVALGCGAREDLDLAIVEAEAAIDRGDLRLDRALVRQEDARRAALDDRGRDVAAVDIGERLGGEDHGRILLAERLQPLAKLLGEGRVVEDQPTLVDDEQGRPAVEAALDAMEEIGQHSGGGASADQPLGLKGLDRCGAELLGLGVEQSAGRAANAIRLQRLLQRRRLQQHREPGDGALLHRRGCQRGERRPDVLLRGRVDGDAFLGEDRRHPLRRPSAFGRIVDLGQRLQRDGVLGSRRQAAAEIVPVAAHGDRRGADGAAEVEREDLAFAVAAKLHRHERQQDGFAGAGRADDQSVADVADVQAQPKRR